MEPKWGFIPEEYSKGCRFCIHKLIKFQTNKKKMSHFCPLDLYSGDISRIRKSLNNLLLSQGNNLRIFKNGEKITENIEVYLLNAGKWNTTWKFFD
jgi:inositol-pentakisphosphate 2-kinase